MFYLANIHDDSSSNAILMLMLLIPIRIGFYFLALRKEDIENLKNMDLLDALLKEFGASFPEFKHVLIDERDQYLTYSLQKAAQPMQNQFQPGGGTFFSS